MTGSSAGASGSNGSKRLNAPYSELRVFDCPFNVGTVTGKRLVSFQDFFN